MWVSDSVYVNLAFRLKPRVYASIRRHATLACYKAIQKANPRVSGIALTSSVEEVFILTSSQLLRHWEWTGQAKIALQAKSEEDILLLQATAQSLNLVARVIQDA